MQEEPRQDEPLRPEQQPRREVHPSVERLPTREFAQVNLDKMAREFAEQFPGLVGGGSRSAFLDPLICQLMVDLYHSENGLRFSFGGYLEDRSYIWRGSYLEDLGCFTHVGVDVNVRAGSLVRSPVGGEVLFVGDDKDPHGGWGPHVLIDPGAGDVAVLYGHLQNVMVGRGDKILADTAFAEVGRAPDNGGWYQHLHVQAVRKDFLRQFRLHEFVEFDGYVPQNVVAAYREVFPDPTPFVPLEWDPLDH